MRIESAQQIDIEGNPFETANLLAPEIVSAANNYAFAIYQNSKLPLRVFEAARIATAVVNGCLVCKNWRVARDLEGMGVDGGVAENGEAPDEIFYTALLAEDTSGLDHREQLAVEYARGMGKNPQSIAADERFWKEFKSEFSNLEITDLSYCIAAWMGLGRVAHVLGIDKACMA